MRMALRPFALAAAVFAAASLPAARASAGGDTDSALEGGVIAKAIWLPDGEGDFKVVGTGLEGRPYEHHFNLARCLCGQDARKNGTATQTIQDASEFAVHLSYSTVPNGDIDVSVQIWTGTQCDAENVEQRECNHPAGENMPLAPLDSVNDDEVRQTVNVPINVADLVDPGNTEVCPTSDVSRFVYAMTNEDGDATFEDSEMPFEIKVDPEAPPAPDHFTTAAGGESAITLEWETPSGSAAYYWQALCARADNSPAPGAASFEPLYETTDVICGLPTTHGPIAHIPVDGVEDAADNELPEGLQALDGAYLCGEAVGTANRMRIEGLVNDVDYYVVLLAVDEAGNFEAVTVDGVLTPLPATDFWEDLHGRGNDSEVEGGFCLIAETYGDGGGPGGSLTSLLRSFRDDTLADSAAGRWLTAQYYQHAAPLGALARASLLSRIIFAIVLLPVVAIALLWHLLTLPGLFVLVLALVALRRLRRGGSLRGLRPALAGAAVVLALGVAPTVASAQDFSPYWEDETPLEDEGPSNVKWHAAFKLGPFVPGIDQQLGHAEGEGPYAAMYGTDWKLLPVLEVDRFLLWPSGQLGVGGSIGFFSQSANAFRADSPPELGPDRERAPGDKTRFRLLPLVINATYRFTMLDDEFGIPVVPYARLGLAYYIWWITAPDGEFARVCDGTGTPDDGMCSLDKARGASLGVQGSLGLAIRAERIDKGAASSMRDSGLYHVGFFAEYQLAKVDGFGSDKKLAVGDSTWFAGIDFEF